MARYNIPATNIGRLQADIDTLNKKAKKLGCDPITFEIVRSYTVEIKPEFGWPYEAVRYEVEVEGKAPTFNGWTLVAKVEPHKEGNIVKTVPGVESIDPRYRSIDMLCEHCKVKRVRNETFVIRHEDGREVVVGRNCIRDFLGHKDPEWVAKMAEWDMALARVMEDAEERGWGSAYRQEEDVDGFVTLVAGLARQYGFVSRKALMEGKPAPFARTTGQLAWDLSACDKDLIEKVEKDGFEVNERDHEQAKAAIAWIRGMEEPAGDYLYNLWVACKADALDVRASGIVASLIAAYKRQMERDEEERVQRETRPARVHLGQPGEKITAKVKVESISEYANDWGVTRRVYMTDENANVLVWWASSYPNFDEGDEIVLKATVKKLDTYNGVPQTIVTRAKAIA